MEPKMLKPIMRSIPILLALAVAAPAAATPEDDFTRGREAFERDDVVTAMRLLGRAADQGHTRAQTLLAYILDRAAENEAAFELYSRAAEKGDAEAMYGLGTMYVSGDAGEVSGEKAVEWFRRAMDAGHGHAVLVLAGAYLKGNLGLTEDRDRALALLKKGAAAGYEPARKMLEEVNRPPAQ
jgi:TPR repeat protein